MHSDVSSSQKFVKVVHKDYYNKLLYKLCALKVDLNNGTRVRTCHNDCQKDEKNQCFIRSAMTTKNTVDMSDFTAELAGLPQQNKNLPFSHLHDNGIKRSI